MELVRTWMACAGMAEEAASELEEAAAVHLVLSLACAPDNQVPCSEEVADTWKAVEEEDHSSDGCTRRIVGVAPCEDLAQSLEDKVATYAAGILDTPCDVEQAGD